VAETVLGGKMILKEYKALSSRIEDLETVNNTFSSFPIDPV